MAVSGLQSTSPNTMMGVRTPDQVTAAIEAERTANQAQNYVQPEPMDSIAAHVLARYEANKQFRAEEIDNILLEDLRQLNGEYDPDKLADLKRNGQPVIFFPLTGEKVRGALSWIMDVQNYDNGKSWTLNPSPIPELSPLDEDAIAQTANADMEAFIAQGNVVSPAVMRQYAAELRDRVDASRQEDAKARAKRMETRIYDQMVEGGWHNAYKDFVHNLTWAPVAYIKGPILRRVDTYEWVQGPFGFYPKPVSKIIPTFEAPSPFDIYPSRDAVTTDDGDLCERIKIAPYKLEAFKGVPGYQDAAIDKVLAGIVDGHVYTEQHNTDSEKERLEHKGSVASSDPRNLIEGVEYWGCIHGKALKEKGVTQDKDGRPLADLKLYEANVTLVGREVIYVAINRQIGGKRPYLKTSWCEKPGSFFGAGVPRLMRELQQMVNATIRALCFNMSQSSGFQTIVNDMARLAPGERLTESFPGKIWQFFNQNRVQNEKPIEFWQPDSRAAELLSLVDRFLPMADTLTGIPRYSYGNDTNGNSSRTLGGLQVLMSNAARGIKMVLSLIDQYIFRPAVNRMFDFNMQYSDDEAIKGDVVVVCSGALSQIVNEQEGQKILALLQTSANPIDAAIIGPQERAAMYRKVAEPLGMPKDSVVKSDKAIAEAIQQQAQQEQQVQQEQGVA